MKQISIFLIIIIAFLPFGWHCTNSGKTVSPVYSDTLVSNINGRGIEMVMLFEKGKSHNHPTFAIWVENMDENYIQTLFVTKSVATGVYGHAAKSDTEWSQNPGEARRPATLPYWLHKRNVKAPDGTYLPWPENPVPDAYTGATPKGSFALKTKTDDLNNGKFRLFLEINQPWDFNNYWYTNKYAGVNYNTSCQPSLIYAVTVDLNSAETEFTLNPIGHGHYEGADGKLYTDLSGFTTALSIMQSVKVKIIRK